MITEIHGRDNRLRHALNIDARSMRVECPAHKGVLVPVTGAKLCQSHNRNACDIKMYLEILCRHCGKYRYVRIVVGDQPTPFTWNE